MTIAGARRDRLRRPGTRASIHRVRLALLLAAVWALGCGRGRGEGVVGEPCRSDFDCAAGYCASAMGNPTVCSPSCLEDGDCPEGWSCHGVTRSGVVVCAQGDAIPIPH